MTQKRFTLSALATLCACVWVMPVAQAQLKNPKATDKEPAATSSTGSKTGAAHYWYDGDIRRPLWVDTQAGTKDAAAIALRDAPAGGQARTLPGGVLVRLKQPMAGDDARRTLAAKGLTPVRPIGDDTSMWLVEADPGLDSLQLANRLYESGDFAAASPNWKRERTKK